jgi:ATP/maltotriose-dependent transcriptional regulator MalT
MRVMIADDAVLFREDLARVLQAVSEVADAVRRVAAGGSVIDPEVVAQLVSRRRTRDPIQELTERERQVLALMAEGRSVAGAWRPSGSQGPAASGP